MEVKKPNGHGNGSKGSNEWRVKVSLAEMLKGGVIMDVTNAEQAKIAENAGACAVMALERVPSDIRKEGSVRVAVREGGGDHSMEMADTRAEEGIGGGARRARGMTLTNVPTP